MRTLTIILFLIIGYCGMGQDTAGKPFTRLERINEGTMSEMMVPFYPKEQHDSIPPGLHQYWITNEEMAWILKRRNDMKVKPVNK